LILRDYQIDLSTRAAEILKLRGLVLLLMMVRTGKTLTALNTCALLQAKRVLFVTKKNIISSIENDFTKSGHAYQLTITNYDQLHKFESGYDVVIVDEFHSFGKFPQASLRTRRLKEICAGSKVVMLSGTPTPESFSQLYHALSVSENSPWKEYRNFYAWAKDYVKVRLKYLYNRQINDYSDANQERILADIEPYSLRFTQSDAGFQTVCEDKVLIAPTPEVVTSSIKLLVKDKIFKTKSGGVVLGDTAVKLMIKVHQLSSGTIKTEEGEYVPFSDFKATFIKEHFAGKKIAIFYKYIAERTHLEKVFNGCIVDTPEEFNATDHSKVYISQIQSGREGINLSAADYLVMYNIDFSALSYWQARERMQAKDRSKESVVYWVMSDGGIEKKIYDVVQGKKDFTLNHFKRIKF
jgi:hypothetical protein